MTGWLVGDKHGVETAGLEEVSVHFVKKVICPVGFGQHMAPVARGRKVTYDAIEVLLLLRRQSV